MFCMGSLDTKTSNSTREKFEEVLALVEFGIPVVRACEKLGLHPQTYYYFKRKGATADTVNPDSQPTETNLRASQHDCTSDASPDLNGDK